MPDQLALLKTALADRYRIERELGQGGMATVYLAEDLKHHRPVALKVLRPELTATLGPARFLREIEVAANHRTVEVQLPRHTNRVPIREAAKAARALGRRHEAIAVGKAM